MKVKINGQNRTIAPSLDIQTFLEQEDFLDKKVAVAINGEFVPKTSYSTTLIQEDDDIEIVAPMQGG